MLLGIEVNAMRLASLTIVFRASHLENSARSSVLSTCSMSSTSFHFPGIMLKALSASTPTTFPSMTHRGFSLNGLMQASTAPAFVFSFVLLQAIIISFLRVLAAQDLTVY